jgi:hypothetical protein
MSGNHDIWRRWRQLLRRNELLPRLSVLLPGLLHELPLGAIALRGLNEHWARPGRQTAGRKGTPRRASARCAMRAAAREGKQGTEGHRQQRFLAHDRELHYGSRPDGVGACSGEKMGQGRRGPVRVGPRPGCDSELSLFAGPGRQ